MRIFMYITLIFLLLTISIYSWLNSKKVFETKTPIKYLVVLYQENSSFDHYFATYPKAKNLPGEPVFHPLPDTPTVNGLSEEMIKYNRNLAKPFRLARKEAITCDHIHGYTEEQKAYHSGLLDRFVESTGNPLCREQVMGYFDGNTVTALWNYAQHFAMSDNFYGSTFGPSTIGAINLISGQTHGANSDGKASKAIRNGTLIANSEPKFDDCSRPDRPEKPQVWLSGKNIGDLLNEKNISWGWFAGGFKPSKREGERAICGVMDLGSDGKEIPSYLPHHEPFQFYKSTANPHHLPPSSVDKIGHSDQANHQYDLSDFWAAARGGDLPSVSFLKASSNQDGHPGYSDPLSEQKYLVETINRLQKLPQWKEMAIIICYDDSDGWYDHVMPPIVNPSNDPEADALTGDGNCGISEKGAYQNRCGYGPRLPFLLISPFAKANFVDHSIIDQSSIIRFIEDNWDLGRIGDQSLDEKAGTIINMFDFNKKNTKRQLYLDPLTGLKEN